MTKTRTDRRTVCLNSRWPSQKVQPVLSRLQDNELETVVPHMTTSSATSYTCTVSTASSGGGGTVVGSSKVYLSSDNGKLSTRERSCKDYYVKRDGGKWCVFSRASKHFGYDTKVVLDPAAGALGGSYLEARARCKQLNQSPDRLGEDQYYIEQHGDFYVYDKRTSRTRGQSDTKWLRCCPNLGAALVAKQQLISGDGDPDQPDIINPYTGTVNPKSDLIHSELYMGVRLTHDGQWVTCHKDGSKHTTLAIARAYVKRYLTSSKGTGDDITDATNRVLAKQLDKKRKILENAATLPGDVHP